MTDPTAASNTPPAPAGGPQGSTPANAAFEDEISLWEVLAVVLRRRGTILLTTFVVGGAAAAFAQSRALTYTTVTSFRPQGSQQSAGQLMALASQFGVAVPGGTGEEAGPAFYAELLTSRELLHRSATRSYEVAGFGTVLLKDLLEIEEDTEPQREQEVYEWLRDEAVAVSTGRETGTVTLSVKTEWPDLSLAVAQQLLSELSLFNMNTRQSQAAAERTFIEARVEQARGDLRVAEDSLRLFLETNRQFENSPLLRFRQEAMMREVTLRSSVLTTLIQSYIEARLSEVRDTPVITVLQDPYFPPRHDPRRRVLFGLLGVVLGAMLGTVLAFVVEALARPSSGDPGREDFDRAWDAVLGSIPFVGRSRA
jgi:uncharacterized protein involved in exopolysaccharide biosynthesis